MLYYYYYNLLIYIYNKGLPLVGFTSRLPRVYLSDQVSARPELGRLGRLSRGYHILCRVRIGGYVQFLTH